jgi:quercetin dioxygenase-like cupin family protein
MIDPAWKRKISVLRRQSPCLLALCIGFLSGFALRGYEPAPKQQESSTVNYFVGKGTTRVRHISNVPVRATSHVDDQGRPITKQQLVEPFDVPNIAGFSVASVKPGQSIANHVHESMMELFYVLSGSGMVRINQNEENRIETGHFIRVVPGEYHSFWVDPTESQEMRMLVCGVAIGTKLRRP